MFKHRNVFISIVVIAMLIVVAFDVYANTVSAPSIETTEIEVKEIGFTHCVEWDDYFNITTPQATINVPSGSPVILRLGWFFFKPHQGRMFLRGSKTEVSIGGTNIANMDHYWSDQIYPLSVYGEPGYGVFWFYPMFGPLPDGSSIDIDWSITITKKISDGHDIYHPGDNWYGTCRIIWGE